MIEVEIEERGRTSSGKHSPDRARGMSSALRSTAPGEGRRGGRPLWPRCDAATRRVGSGAQRARKSRTKQGLRLLLWGGGGGGGGQRARKGRTKQGLRPVLWGGGVRGGQGGTARAPLHPRRAEGARRQVVSATATSRPCGGEEGWPADAPRRAAGAQQGGAYGSDDEERNRSPWRARALSPPAGHAAPPGARPCRRMARGSPGRGPERRRRGAIKKGTSTSVSFFACVFARLRNVRSYVVFARHGPGWCGTCAGRFWA